MSKTIHSLAFLVLAACSAPSGGEASGSLSPSEPPGPPGTTTGSTPSPPPPVALPPVASGPEHLRYLAINVGNVALPCEKYEWKLCTHGASEQVRSYIATWQPDVVLLAEVLDEPQLDRVLHDLDLHANGNAGSDLGGPILPAELGYDHVCHASLGRLDGQAHDAFPLDTPDASHRHECVAWRRSRLSLVDQAHVLPPDPSCSQHFTIQAATLRINGTSTEVTGIAVHPDSRNSTCRVDTLARMWKDLATRPNTFVAGDWNTAQDAELQVPTGFLTNYSRGLHFGHQHEGEYTAWYYLRGGLKLDHAFSNFGKPCVDCGQFYGGGDQDLSFGSAIGRFDGHPSASQTGLDHRQVLVDLSF